MGLGFHLEWSCWFLSINSIVYSRHEGINDFIIKTLSDAKTLVENGIVEKLMFVTFGENASIKDEIVLQFSMAVSSISRQSLNANFV